MQHSVKHKSLSVCVNNSNNKDDKGYTQVQNYLMILAYIDVLSGKMHSDSI